MRNMRGLYSRLQAIEEKTMLAVYSIDLLSIVGYIYASLISRSGYWDGVSNFYVVFYSVVVGMMAVLDAALISGLIAKKLEHKRMALLLVYVALQASTILTDFVFTVQYGRFWRIGYINLLYEAITVVIYLRRFLTLRACCNETGDTS